MMTVGDVSKMKASSFSSCVITVLCVVVLLLLFVLFHVAKNS